MSLDPVVSSVVTPWEDSLSSGEHSLILYALVVAGLALLASFLKAWTSRSEVGARYRGAVLASLCLTAVAFMSYVVLVVEFQLGYDLGEGGRWFPQRDAIWSWASRYMDWSITVPLLVVEVIAVSALAGARARRIRCVGVAAAFAMIFAGYLGGVVIDDGRSLTALWIWGIVSGVFMALLYVLVIRTVVVSLPSMTTDAGATYRHALVLLLVVWFAYPVAFGLQGLAQGGTRTTVMQVLVSAADITAKVGFGVLIHKVAKLRTAQDVREGVDEHPESIWISSERYSRAALPPVSAEAVVGSSQSPVAAASSSTVYERMPTIRPSRNA